MAVWTQRGARGWAQGGAQGPGADTEARAAGRIDAAVLGCVQGSSGSGEAAAEGGGRRHRDEQGE